ncbi:hypothetical protein HK097_003820 [Rhizophlyctis rosea]|uniref:Uncharacterized protein n=1 Tax=Rhizophlyctis rosea TaxID=64517 RepID=A0AAD5SFU0_9FUNG|nr:hypothetical protein HK097_003820 [Rhizophlyctis rosea]
MSGTSTSTETTTDTNSFYKAIFESQENGTLVLIKPLHPTQAYAQALESAPHRFSLENLGRIFGAWVLAAQEVEGVFVRGNALNSTVINYTVPDNGVDIQYYSTCWTHTEYWGKSQGLFLNIHLANDGFLYKRLKDMVPAKEERGPVHSHTKTGEWLRLALGTYGTAIEPLVTWAKRYLGIRKSKVEVYYSFDEERVDLKVIDLETRVDGVKFCFEPGPPVTPWESLDEM